MLVRLLLLRTVLIWDLFPRFPWVPVCCLQLAISRLLAVNVQYRSTIHALLTDLLSAVCRRPPQLVTYNLLPKRNAASEEWD
jgi:hypothetical protein